jgi:hypothetical protein
MRAWTAERWAAAAGVAFVALLVIATFAPGGSYPKFDDPPAKILSYFHDHHRAIAIGAILGGLAAPLFIWFASGFARVVRAAGQAAVATTFFGVIVAGTALAAGSDAMSQVLPRIDNGSIAKSLFQAAGYLALKAFWCIAIGAFVVSIAGMRGALPRWFAWLSAAGAVLFALGGVTVKGSGFFAPNGGMALIAFIGIWVWTLAASFVLWTRPAIAEAPAPAAY